MYYLLGYRLPNIANERVNAKILENSQSGDLDKMKEKEIKKLVILLIISAFSFIPFPAILFSDIS